MHHLLHWMTLAMRQTFPENSSPLKFFRQRFLNGKLAMDHKTVKTCQCGFSWKDCESLTVLSNCARPFATATRESNGKSCWRPVVDKPQLWGCDAVEQQRAALDLPSVHWKFEIDSVEPSVLLSFSSSQAELCLPRQISVWNPVVWSNQILWKFLRRHKATLLELFWLCRANLVCLTSSIIGVDETIIPCNHTGKDLFSFITLSKSTSWSVKDHDVRMEIEAQTAWFVSWTRVFGSSKLNGKWSEWMKSKPHPCLLSLFFENLLWRSWRNNLLEFWKRFLSGEFKPGYYNHFSDVGKSPPPPAATYHIFLVVFTFATP